MAEIQGIPANSTSTVNSGDATVTAAMGSTLANIEANTKATKDNTFAGLNYLKTISQLLAPKKSSGSAVNSTRAIEANTLALYTLSNLISTKEFTLTLKGNGQVTYFAKMFNAMTDAKAIIAIDKFSKVFAAAVSSIAELDKYSKKIENLGGTLLGAMGSFKEIGKGLLFLSGGLAVLGITLAALVQVITPEALIVFGGIILALRLAGELSGGATWEFAKLAVSISLLGISIWAFTELVNFDMTVNFAASLLAITGAMWAMSKIAAPIAKQSKQMFVASGAIAIMAGSMWLVSKAMANLEDFDAMVATKNIIAIGALGVVYSLMGGAAVNIAIGAVAAGLIGGSLWLMSKGLQSMTEVTMTFEQGMGIIGMMIGAAGVIALIGNPVTAAFIGTGVLLTAGIGGALWALSKGLNNIGLVKVTPEQAESFKKSLFNVIEVMSSLGNPFNAIPIGISAPVALALAAATLGIAGAMKLVSGMPAIKPEQFKNFKIGIGELQSAISALGNPLRAIPIGIAVPVALALAGATLGIAGAMKLVSVMPMINPMQFLNFKTGVLLLSDAIIPLGGAKMLYKIGLAAPVAGALALATLGMWGAMKLVSKIPMVNPFVYENFKTGIISISNAMLPLGEKSIRGGLDGIVGNSLAIRFAIGSSLSTIQKFQSYDLDGNKIKNNLEVFGIFFGGIIDSFKSNEGSFGTIERGVKAYAGLTRLTRGLAKTVQSFANLTFDEHDIVDGKIVKTGTTKLSSKDLAQVGISIGSILNALTSPLANIGGAKNTYEIGGFTITNPFSNKVQEGIAAMAKIGNMLKPITDAVLSFTSNNINVSAIKQFNWGIAAILSTISVSVSTAAKNLDDDDIKLVQHSLSMVHKLNAAVTQPGFSAGVVQFRNYSKDLAQVKSTINDINLDKLNKLTMMLGHLSELNKSQGLNALIESFKEFIEVFIDYTDARKEELESRSQTVYDPAMGGVPHNSGGIIPIGGGYAQSNPLIQNQPSPFAPATPAPVAPEPVGNMDEKLDRLYREMKKLTDGFFVNQTPIKTIQQY